MHVCANYLKKSWSDYATLLSNFIFRPLENLGTKLDKYNVTTFKLDLVMIGYQIHGQ